MNKYLYVSFEGKSFRYVKCYKNTAFEQYFNLLEDGDLVTTFGGSAYIFVKTLPQTNKGLVKFITIDKKKQVCMSDIAYIYKLYSPAQEINDDILELAGNLQACTKRIMDKHNLTREEAIKYIVNNHIF